MAEAAKLLPPFRMRKPGVLGMLQPLLSSRPAPKFSLQFSLPGAVHCLGEKQKLMSFLPVEPQGKPDALVMKMSSCTDMSLL